MRSFIPFILALFTICVANAQTEIPPLVTDRPDQTESATVIDPGFVQVETGALREKDAFTLATTLLRIGIRKPFELRITGEYVMESGVNGVSLGGKLHFLGERGFLPETAILAHFQSSGGARLLLAMAHTLSDRLDFSYNLGHEFGDDAVLTYTSAIGMEIWEQAGGFVEIFGEVLKGGKTSVQFDTGFTYLLQPNLQIDISGGFVLVEDSPDWFLSAGISMRLPR